MNVPDALMQRFFARFDQRLIELTRLAHASDEDALALAFHSLAGIGGTYGFQEITIVARAAEQGRRDVWDAIGELERIRNSRR